MLAGARGVTDWSRYKTDLTYSTGSVDITDRSESGEVTPYLGLVVDLGAHWSAYANYTSIFKPQQPLLLHRGRCLLDPQTGRQL